MLPLTDRRPDSSGPIPMAVVGYLHGTPNLKHLTVELRRTCPTLIVNSRVDCTVPLLQLARNPKPEAARRTQQKVFVALGIQAALGP